MAQGINPDKLDQEEEKSVVTLACVLKSYQDIRKNLTDATKRDYEYHLNNNRLDNLYFAMGHSQGIKVLKSPFEL